LVGEIEIAAAAKTPHSSVPIAPPDPVHPEDVERVVIFEAALEGRAGPQQPT
jgi:hypothetical protein